MRRGIVVAVVLLISACGQIDISPNASAGERSQAAAPDAGSLGDFFGLPGIDADVQAIRDSAPTSISDVRALLTREQALVAELKDARAKLGALIATATDMPDEQKAMSDLDEQLAALEDQLQSIGDDSQLASLDLQNVLQKQQQTLQLISNISKTLNDTAMSVIRKTK